jgi:hypothetical protein
MPFPWRRLASRGQQVEDIGSNLRWTRIPFALPVRALGVSTRNSAWLGAPPEIAANAASPFLQCKSTSEEEKMASA